MDQHFCFRRCLYYLVSNEKISFGIRISEEAEKLGTDKAEVGVMAYSIRD